MMSMAPSLMAGAGGSVVSSPAHRDGKRQMNEREYEIMAAVEDCHFWFVGIRGIVRDAYLAAGLGPESRVLDVGCATGGMMRLMHGLGRFTGLDASAKAAKMARERSGNEVVVSSATSMPFETGTFDGVTALDVLEHIEDHVAAVREIRRVLKPGSPLIATVPCHPALYSRHDTALHHVRRYKRPEFLALLQDNGFTIERATWTNSLLFPMAIIQRMAERLVPGRKGDAQSDVGTTLSPLNGLLTTIMGAERRLAARHDLPFGLSLMVVAR